MSEAERAARRRRVLIVVENLPVPFDRRVWSEATTLAQAGYAVSVICPQARGQVAPYEELEGVAIYRHPLTEASGTLGYLREYAVALFHQTRLAIRVLRRQGIDILQGCNPPDLIFLVAWALRPFGVRYLFDHHDLCPELFEVKFARRGILWRAMRAAEWLTFRTALVTIATNDSFREIALERGGKAAEDVFVVRSAPRLDKFRPGPGDPSAKKGFPFLLGYVGVIGEQEGMDLLIAALDHLVRALGRRDVHLAIVGFGPYLPEVERDVAARGLEAHVTFTGPLYGEDLLAVLNAADICVSPDAKNPMNDRSTMNKVVEYMTLGKPVVQFDLREGRFSAGEAALYAEENDPEDFARQIARLLDDPELRRRMGATGRARVERELSWEHSAPRLLAAYDRAFEKAGKA